MPRTSEEIDLIRSIGPCPKCRRVPTITCRMNSPCYKVKCAECEIVMGHDSLTYLIQRWNANFFPLPQPDNER